MFKKVQKKGTNRVREEDNENQNGTNQISQSDGNMNSKDSYDFQGNLNADKQSQQETKQVNVDEENEEDQEDHLYEPSFKKKVESKFRNKRQPALIFKHDFRRGFVHQGSIQSQSMSYTQSHDSNQLTNDGRIEEDTKQKSKFSQIKPKTEDAINTNEDIEMMHEGDIIAPQSDDEEEFFSNQETINRIKQLRNQKRKLDGKDYVPFDESTSGGVFAKDQINAVNNQRENLEAHLLQRQLINSKMERIDQKRTQKRQMVGIIDMDDEDVLMVDEDDDNDAEMEAFIKQRVKEGTGKEYEQIVKKDIVNYNRVKGEDSEFTDVTKYENSADYRQVMTAMDFDMEAYLEDIDQEGSTMEQKIQNDKSKLFELTANVNTSQSEIKQSDTDFQKIGEQFMVVKESADTLEDLKDMLNEKSRDIEDLMKRKFSLSTEQKSIINQEIMCHIADLYRKKGELSQPYVVTQKFSTDLDNKITDQKLQTERKIFRQSHSNNLFKTIINKVRNQQMKSMKYIQYEALNNIFEDCDEKYQKIDLSVLKAINSIQGIMGYKASLNEVQEMIIPYVIVEILGQDPELIIPEDFEKLSISDSINKFLNQNQEYYTTDERNIFLSKLIGESYQSFFLNLVNNQWNPFDLEETAILAKLVKTYTDQVYLLQGQTDSQFGLKYIKELLDAVIFRYKSTIDMLHMTLKTITCDELTDGLKIIADAIMEWKDILPWSKIIQLIIDEILTGNLLKQLNKVQDSQMIQRFIEKFFDDQFKIFYQLIIAEINEKEDESINKMKKAIKLIKDNHDIQFNAFIFT